MGSLVREYVHAPSLLRDCGTFVCCGYQVSGSLGRHATLLLMKSSLIQPRLLENDGRGIIDMGLSVILLR